MKSSPGQTRFHSRPVRWVVRRFFQFCGLVLVLAWAATWWLWGTSFDGFPDSPKRSFGYAPKYRSSSFLSIGHFRMGDLGAGIYLCDSYEGRIWLNYYVDDVVKYAGLKPFEWADEPDREILQREMGLRNTWVPPSPGAHSLVCNTIVSLHQENNKTGRYVAGLSFPHWLLLLGLSIPVLFVARSYRRGWRAYLRRKQGLCQACGYSLRGLASTACPECGCAFEPAETTAPDPELV